MSKMVMVGMLMEDSFKNDCSDGGVKEVEQGGHDGVHVRVLRDGHGDRADARKEQEQGVCDDGHVGRVKDRLEVIMGVWEMMSKMVMVGMLIEDRLNKGKVEHTCKMGRMI